MMTGFQAEENLTGRAPKKMCEKFWTLSNQVNITEIWSVLDYHPMFPSEAYRNEIKRALINYFGAKQDLVYDSKEGKSHQTITFKDLHTNRHGH